ncbi:MAG: class I SAM-dependent methyltransferase [Eubacterium sp.]|nr:class I SAM-dependent methyltransferase [Eubacterium sp.]
MFWDKVAGIYDLFGNIYNGRVNRELCRIVASQISPKDAVLECACGTGMITVCIAPKCRRLIATDLSDGMLKRARKKCAGFTNVQIRHADILSLDFPDETFSKVVAANVIHLLDEPYKALSEMERVLKPGGKLIIPTYVNKDRARGFDRTIDKAGAGFKQDFTYETYRAFFERAGYKKIGIRLIDGRVPCAVAVITKEKTENERQI